MPRNIDAFPFSQISDQAFRVLTAVEMCMKNHEGVDLRMIRQVARIKCSLPRLRDTIRTELIENKLLRYDNGDEFSRLFGLSQRGYDYLALRKLCKSEQVTHLGNMIGTGKESVIYLGLGGNMCGVLDMHLDDTEDRLVADNKESCASSIVPVPTESKFANEEIVIKFHRLGHQSFKKAKSLRQYHARQNPHNWFYMARLAAQREYQVLKVLNEQGFPVPVGLAQNRNAVVMEFLRDYTTLNKLKRDYLSPELWTALYHEATSFAVRFAKLGLVHGDLNEFNLMLHNDCMDPDFKLDPQHPPDHPILMIIDFPQMISRDHTVEAQMQYERDLDALHAFFEKRGVDLNSVTQPPVSLRDIERTATLDVSLRVPGYVRPKDAAERENDSSDDDSCSALSADDECTTLEEAADVITNEEGLLTATLDSSSEHEDEEESSANESAEEEEELDDAVATTSSTSTATETRRSKKVARLPTEVFQKRLLEKERRRETNQRLQKDVTRQMRAARKRKNRLELKSELKLF